MVGHFEADRCCWLKRFQDALQRFVLISSQEESGGLKDKPDTKPDSYHTVTNLAGLASAQHHVFRPKEFQTALSSGFKPELSLPNEAFLGPLSKRAELRRKAFVASTSWKDEVGASRYVGGKPNRVVSPP